MKSQPTTSLLSDVPVEAPKVLLLATGGTIAGWSAPGQAQAYKAAQLGVDALVQAVPALRGLPLQCEQLAQVDSKDMGPAVWRALVRRVADALADPKVTAVVVTHGTDTLEETAYLLSRLLRADKPVVFTASMRPANAPDADGPRNLADAVAVARLPGARGVLAVLHGCVWAGAEVRKLHTQAIDAFGTADALPLAVSQVPEGGLSGHWVQQRAWPEPRDGWGWGLLPEGPWPRVEIVTSHAGADGRIVDLLVADGVQGLVLAGTGNGTLHQQLEAALHRAVRAGVAVRRASRVGQGAVTARAGETWRSAGVLSPAQARVALLLDLLQRAA